LHQRVGPEDRSPWVLRRQHRPRVGLEFTEMDAIGWLILAIVLVVIAVVMFVVVRRRRRAGGVIATKRKQ
jgi:heme/copper-type cytochrome/quinol oxidase subunit 2